MPPEDDQPGYELDAPEDNLTGDELDDILAELETRNIEFNAPSEIRLGDTVKIQLLLSSSSLEDLKEQITEPGETKGAKIRVSDRMRAQLTSGSAFETRPLLPEDQPISSKENTKWKWAVKAIAPGEHELHLTVSALIYVDEEKDYRVIETFDEPITVNVPWPQRGAEFIGKNWQWLFAVIVGPGA